MVRIAAMLLLAAVAGSAGARRTDPPPVRADGPALSCIPLNSIRETRVRDDRTIDFYTTGRRVYRNVLPQGCPQLGFEQRFSYGTSLSQLCSTDIITVFELSPPIRGASCGLGQFQPVTGAPR